MPGGCGEQTLLGFVPDIAIYKYLKATNQLTPALNDKLNQYLLAGYQNELNYQRYDGGFSAFGNNDASSSTWLSAYAAWSFYLAKDYITISSNVIQNSLDFIVQQAKTDGSFNEPGRVIHSDMQGEAGSGVALTAYVTIVLSTLANDYPGVKLSRDAAVAYLVNQLDSITDAYTLGVIANALQAAGSSKATDAFDKFYALKSETPTEVSWKKPVSANQNFYYAARSVDIEITSYGLRLLVARNSNLDTVIKVVKYLISQSNSFGGYSSSQDTVMALIALSDFASAYSLNLANMNIKLNPNVGNVFNVTVDATNSLTLQSFSLNEKARKLLIQPSGTGVAIVSLTCNFYDDPSKVTPSFNVTSVFLSTCRYRTQVQICAKYTGAGSSSNMAIMEVRLPSGFIYQQAWWNPNPNPDISKIETYESNTVVVYYFNNISNKGTCVTLDAYRSGEVGNLKPGTVQVTDYYDTCEKNIKTFSFILLITSIYFTDKEGSAFISVPNGNLNDNCYPIYY